MSVGLLVEAGDVFPIVADIVAPDRYFTGTILRENKSHHQDSK